MRWCVFFEEKKIDLAIHVFPNKELARVFKKAKIPYRLGTKNRLYHWSTCNLRVKLSRKNSHFHESQLNIKLLKDIIPQSTYSIEELAKNYGLLKTPKLNQHVQSFLKEDRINIVLHPRSLGSAREWGLNNYKTLVKELHQTGRYNILITGTQKESESMKKELLDPCREMITDTTGKLTLGELISLITASKGLVAASTGPLHIASACGVNALGLFIMTRPMHPGRWKPVGLKADYIVYDEKDTSLDSIYKISPKRVFERIEKWV
jgi:heptosyltransferase-3